MPRGYTTTRHHKWLVKSNASDEIVELAVDGGQGNTFLLISHEQHVVKHARRIIHLSDDNIERDERLLAAA